MSNDTENQPKLEVTPDIDINTGELIHADPTNEETQKVVDDTEARLKSIGENTGVISFKLKKGESLLIEQEEEEKQDLDTEELLEKLDELGVTKEVIMDHFEIPTSITVTVEDNYGSVVSQSECYFEEWEDGNVRVDIDTDDMRNEWFDDFNTSVSVEVECHNTGVRLPIENEDWENDLVNIKVDLTNYGEESKESLKETVEVEVKEEVRDKIISNIGKEVTKFVNEALNSDTKE
jgi:hypothetical protein